MDHGVLLMILVMIDGFMTVDNGESWLMMFVFQFGFKVLTQALVRSKVVQ